MSMGPPRRINGRTVLFCLLGFFGVVIGVNGVMIHAAVSSFGGVETESSYKAGLAFAKEIAAARTQDRKNWRVHAAVVSHAEGHRIIEVIARDENDRLLSNVDVKLQLSHPTDRRSDLRLALTQSSPGRYVGTIAVPPGQWDLIIELSRGGDRLFRSKSRILVIRG